VSGGGRAGSIARILVVEDDEGIRETLKYNLVAAGYTVLEAADGATAVRTAQTGRPDLVLLDLMLPGLSGIEVTRVLRRSSRVPIIMLTAKADEVDKIVGLEIGADDYITKPFSVREVLARVNAVLRRLQPVEAGSAPEREALGDFSIDRAARRVLVRGEELRLTAREFDLLSFLVAHPDRVYTRDGLLSAVWGADFAGDRKTVDVHVRWLRSKLEDVEAFRIVTVRGVGYRLDRALKPSAA
jgi:DNA-binding response OmpR family regulator